MRLFSIRDRVIAVNGAAIKSSSLLLSVSPQLCLWLLVYLFHLVRRNQAQGNFSVAVLVRH